MDMTPGFLFARGNDNKTPSDQSGNKFLLAQRKTLPQLMKIR